MRGKLYYEAIFQQSEGSIPAHAGETGEILETILRIGVYPRTCGGNRQLQNRVKRFRGLSPHMRGKPVGPRTDRTVPGSIPAHAGETSYRTCPLGHVWVYPRTCGGNRHGGFRVMHQEGLSPHMRGKRIRIRPEEDMVGSIPAHAGETPPSCRGAPKQGVYPRTCGGNRSPFYPSEGDWGLSPHMRGKPVNSPGNSIHPGSIPAHAGETLVDNPIIHKRKT